MPPSASSNWLALQKKIATPGKPKKRRAEPDDAPAAKRRKLAADGAAPRPASPPASTLDETLAPGAPSLSRTKNGESLLALRSMIHGHVSFSPSQSEPGKYIALDCEMVGVGPEGAESALARVSAVNFHGALLLDAFVRPRERVVDYRTQFSGIRPGDMVHAKSFEEVQKEVGALLDGRILVGHAVHNDLKALLLTHPRPQTRDTQYYAYKHKVVKSNRIALRVLALQELGVAIQGGEHSSVTDARATMAIYRVHRREWEKGQRPVPDAAPATSKRKDARVAVPATQDELESDADTATTKCKAKKKSNADAQVPGGGRKGVSSGLSVVVTHRDGNTKAPSRVAGTKPKAKAGWWKELGGGAGGAKGSVRLKA